MSVNDQAHGLPDAVASACAGGDNAVVRTLGPGFDADYSGGGVSQERRDGEGRYLCAVCREKRNAIVE